MKVNIKSVRTRVPARLPLNLFRLESCEGFAFVVIKGLVVLPDRLSAEDAANLIREAVWVQGLA